MRSVSADRGVPRAARGATMACCATVLAITAHVLGGGSAPPTWLVLALTALVAAAGTVLADRQRGPVALLLMVAATQTATHLLLDATLHNNHAAHVHHAVSTPAASPIAMAALHAAASVIMAVLLACADRAVFTVAGVLRWLGRLVLRACSPVPAPQRRRLPVLPAAGSRFVDTVLRRLCGRRAPPISLH